MKQLFLLLGCAVAFIQLCAGAEAAKENGVVATKPDKGSSSADTADTAKQKEITQQRMLQIYEAIQAYRKERKELPPFLSDLYPKYVADTNVFLCPASKATDAEGLPGGFRELRDDKLAVQYGFEFNANPIS